MIGTPLCGDADSYRLLTIDECASTNTLCMDYAAQAHPANLWVVSERQSAGKGSRGRQWTSEKGNLFASLLLQDPADTQHLSELTFVAAVALRETILRVSNNSVDIKLKWPNDILLNGKKCSGILLESRLVISSSYVVIGIGINCQHFPQDTLHKATSLIAEGIDIKAPDLFSVLSEEIAQALKLWNRGGGFADIRKIWLAHASGIGEKVTVRIPNRDDICGIFASIDEAGYMLLETSDNKIERISTADIFFT